MKKLIWIVALLWISTAFAQTEDPNNKILKDAVVGAVTGAVAVEATKDEPSPAAGAPATPAEEKHHKHKNFTQKHHKDKKRPYGWDQGKKTGWGDSDVPPGQAKKN